MVMFMGEYRHNLDARNRLIIPAKYRDQIDSPLYVTKWLDGCLAAYVEADWMKMIEKLNTLPKNNAAARAYVRHITGKADECTIDNAGRILLPQFLLKDTHIEKNVVIVGASDHFEIWPEETYDSYDENMYSDGNFENLAESLDGLL